MNRLTVLRLSYDFLSITSQAKSDFIGARSALSYCHTIFAHILLLKNIFCFYFLFFVANIVKTIRQTKKLNKEKNDNIVFNWFKIVLNLKRQD